MYGFFNVWVCVCVCLLIYGCVYVWIFNLWVCLSVFLMSGYFINMHTCNYSVFTMFPLGIFILICFVCIKLRTTATVCQSSCST